MIKDLAAKASFPILSANTYTKETILDQNGKNVDVSSQCIPAVTGTQIDWTKAGRPDFLKPYLIKDVAGARVALIGIDTTDTPLTTTAANVSDLCFRDEFDAYKDMRAQLEGKADVFVLVIHDGNSNNDFRATDLVKKLLADNVKSVDAVVSGHTHYVYNVNVDNVPLIQSGHGGDKFGRIDLVYNVSTHSVDRSKTVSIAGAPMDYAACDQKIQSFCQVSPTQDGVLYEGLPVVLDPAVLTKISDVKKQLDPMASRVVGHASADLKVNRTDESALADALTDAFRSASGAEVAFMNTGGIRSRISRPAMFDTTTFFRFCPSITTATSWAHEAFDTDRSFDQIRENLRRLRSPDAKRPARHLRPQLHELRHRYKGPADSCRDAGRRSDYDEPNGVVAKETRIFNVATLDFLSEGGAGYSDFIGTPKINDIGNLREILAESLVKNPAQWNGAVDGRWKLLTAVPAPAPNPPQAPAPAPAPHPAVPQPVAAQPAPAPSSSASPKPLKGQ